LFIRFVARIATSLMLDRQKNILEPESRESNILIMLDWIHWGI